MARRTLTDRLLRTLKVDASDSVVPGLAVRIGSAGQKTFVLIARYPGRTNPTRRAIGAYPAISLEQARNTARAWISLIQRGIDPAAQVALERQANHERAANTFAAVAEEFLQKHVATRRTASTIGRIIRNRLIARWGSRPVDSVNKRDVVAMVEDVRENSGPVMSRSTLACARRLFGWAAARDLIVLNPCSSIRPGDFLPAVVTRDRVLSDSELRLVLQATRCLNDGTGPYTRFVLATACRRAEAGDATWSEFDLAQGIWLLPAARSKNANEHVLPLPAAVLELLAGLPRFASGYVFGRHKFGGFSRRKAKLDARITELNNGVPIAPYTWHDLRRSAASGMAALGIAPHIVEAVLNHRGGIISGVARIYNRFDFLSEKRHALTTWANHLDRLEHGNTVDNIVQLRP